MPAIALSPLLYRRTTQRTQRLVDLLIGMSPVPPSKEVLVVGLGAVGAVYVYCLKKSGLVRVTVVARSNYDAINAQGLTFRSARFGEVTGWRPDRLCKSVADATDQPYSSPRRQYRKL